MLTLLKRLLAAWLWPAFVECMNCHKLCARNEMVRGAFGERFCSDTCLEELEDFRRTW